MFRQATLSSSLEDFYNSGLISDVLRIVKSGKEATVYCCAAGASSLLPPACGPLLAAKIYRPAQMEGFGSEALRSGRHGGRFRNDSLYTAGRGRGFKRRDRVAFEKKTRHGRSVQFGSWIYAEWESLQAVHAAGCDVPTPLSLAENAILMEHMGDENDSAPVLANVSLDADEAEAVYRRILENVELFLGADRVHADLSAFNILYWDGAIKIIDFPQAVDARTNPNALMLLERDLHNVSAYFSRYGMREDTGLAGRLWGRYRRGAL